MEVMEMDLSTFCATTHRIKIQFSEGKLSRESAINKIANLSYQEAMLSDFHIDEDYSFPHSAHIVQRQSTIQHTPSYSHAQRSKPLKLRQKEIRSLTPEL